MSSPNPAFFYIFIKKALLTPAFALHYTYEEYVIIRVGMAFIAFSCLGNSG